MTNLIYKIKSGMGCNSYIKQGALDGVLMGLVGGAILGCLDSVITIIHRRNAECVDFISRVLNGMIQGGILGLLVGTALGYARGPCMVNMKSGMVDGMLVGMLLGAVYGAFQVYRSEETPDTQKAAIDIADWSVHVAVVCALIGALIALAKGI